jgi:uncharacterized protein
MTPDHPLLLVALCAGSCIVGKWWLDDWRAGRDGALRPGAFPGATRVDIRSVGLAMLGALALLAVETGGEYALGISDRQSHITVLFGIYTLAAAFLEELIFRGYLVVDKHGRGALWAGVVAASALFALLHSFLWRWEDGALSWQSDRKAVFSAAMAFAGSLWFYTVRLWLLNPRRSLLPCIAAHATKNLGVFAIKGAQGFVSGWW